MAIELEETPALVVIDLQVGILGFPTAHPIADVIDKSAALAEAFRAKGLPVVLVNVAGGAPGRTERSKASGQTGPRVIPAEAMAIVPELNQQPSDIT
ncbi:MAG: isochorismatase family protein, partial [Microbacteriaceae bacterium]|nr:isochorismatase family protein [Microbacteriaceae bacterium]